MRGLVSVLLVAAGVCLVAGCGKENVPATPPERKKATSSVSTKTLASVPQANVADAPQESGSDTNRMADIVSRLLEQPRKGPPTDRIHHTASESKIAGDPREKVQEVMELMVKNADRELALMTRQRHETELRLRESDPVIREAFSSFIRSRDSYYMLLERNAEYQKALEKEAEAYSTLTNAMARLDALKEGSNRK